MTNNYSKIKQYTLKISYHCNNNCRFCYNSGGENIQPKLDIKGIEQEIKKAKKMGYGVINLFGGEPTIHPQFFDILNFIQKQDLLVRIETNGRMFCYPDFCERVLKYNIHSLQISIHGHNALIHDWATMTPNSFKQTIKGILNLKEINPDIAISVFTVINKKNYKYLLNIAKFIVEKLGIEFVNLSFIETIGRASQDQSSLVEFSKVHPYLLKFLNYLKKSFNEQRVREFSIERGPVCLFPDFYSNYRFKESMPDSIKHEVCQSCVFDEICSGFSKKYVNLFGFDGLRLGNVSKENLKYLFSSINMRDLAAVKKNVKFDFFNNPVLNIPKGVNKKNLGKFKDNAKKFGLSLLSDQGKLVQVYDDYIVKLPEYIKNSKESEEEKDLILLLSNKVKNDFGAILSQKNIILTTGCHHSLLLVLVSMIRPGDEIILQKPCWGGYGEGIKNLRGITKEVGQSMNMQEIKRNYSKRTKLIIITNPYLRDLKVLPYKSMLELVKFCSDKKIYLIIDEIINRLLPKPVSFLKHFDIEKKPIIIINSFSKNYFMPFYRSGYLIANSKLINRARKIIEFSDFKINPKSVSASIAALKGNQAWRDKIAQKIYQKGKYF